MLKRVRTGVMELLFEKRKLSFGEFKAAPQLITSQWKQRQGWYLNQPTNYSLGYNLCPKVTTRRARRTSLTTFCVSDPILQICVAPLGWQTQAAFVGEWASIYEEIHPGVSLLTCLAFAFHLSICDAHTGQEKSKTSTGKNDSFPPGRHPERFPAAFSQIKPKSPVGPMPPPNWGMYHLYSKLTKAYICNLSVLTAVNTATNLPTPWIFHLGDDYINIVFGYYGLGHHIKIARQCHYPYNGTQN